MEKKRSGFTLVELMIVVIIVGILAAVAIPIMRGRIDSAKWTEGKAMAGTIATAIRAYSAEKGNTGVYGDQTALTWTLLGLDSGDFNGTYFDPLLFSWTSSYDDTTGLDFTVTVNRPAEITSEPQGWELSVAGIWAPVSGL